MPQPLDLCVEPAFQRFAGRNCQLRDAYHIGHGTLIQAGLRGDPHVVGGNESARLRRDHQRSHQPGSGLSINHKSPIAAGRHEQVVDAVHDRGRGLWECEDANGHGSMRLGHGRFVRFVADTALVNGGGTGYLLFLNLTRRSSAMPASIAMRRVRTHCRLLQPSHKEQRP
jgi:hypothetical protein